jgi:hypothetical protein
MSQIAYLQATVEISESMPTAINNLSVNVQRTDTGILTTMRDMIAQ